jgi:hypothetical protein
VKTATRAESPPRRATPASGLEQLKRIPEPVQRDLGPALAGTVLPFALVVYLALDGGGYDSLVYSQVGIAAWWLLVLGALVGVLPFARPRPAAWLGLGLLTAFCVWTALGIAWSESAERSVAEVGRVAAYLGVFALALAVQGPDGIRRTVKAVAAAIALVGALALLSRLHPAWFPTDETASALGLTPERLNYPLNYWNGLAALMAIGIPLVLAVAANARTLVARALAAAAVPVLALTAFYTLSRGGIVAAGVGVTTLLVIYPRRLALMPTLLSVGGGTAILIAGAVQRGALADGLDSAAARSQGDEMLAMTLVVCAGVALVQVAIGLAARHGLGPRPSVSRRTTLAVLGTAAAVALVAGLASGMPGKLSDRWEEFKHTGSPGQGVERLESTRGHLRYQVWDSAVDASAGDPITGIGPGNFEYWWARHKSVGTFARDAHSLYVETLGELGIVGLALILALVGSVLVVGSRRAFRGREDGRPMLAGATAACFAFAVAGAVDWVWELAVLPVAFLLLSAAILGGGRLARDGIPGAAPVGRTGALPIPLRLGLVPVAAACLLAIAIPMAGTAFVRDSQEHADAGELGAALDDARRARDIEPFAARPRLQEALVLEASRDVDGAAAAARDAIRAERSNWRNWFVLARIEAERGRKRRAVEAYREAASLNPRSPLFPGPDR